MATDRPEEEQRDVGLAHEVLDLLAVVRRIAALLLYETDHMVFSIMTETCLNSKILKGLIQRVSSSHSQNFKDEDFGNSPGLWAATVANYCPSRAL